MSVLTAKKPRQEQLTAHQRLHQIDVRIAEAKAEANEMGRKQQLASQAATNADLDLIKAQGRHGAEQISDKELAQVREAYDVAKLEADKPWKRDLAVAQAKVVALALPGRSVRKSRWRCPCPAEALGSETARSTC